MPDNKKLVGLLDKKRINMNQDYEVDYWKKRFNVSGQALAGAVRAVGTSVAKVQKHLMDKKLGLK